MAAIDSERFDIDDLALAPAEQHSDRQFRNILQCCDVPRLWERSNLAGHKNLLEWFWGVTTLGQKNRFGAVVVKWWELGPSTHCLGVFDVAFRLAFAGFQDSSETAVGVCWLATASIE